MPARGCAWAALAALLLLAVAFASDADAGARCKEDAEDAAEPRCQRCAPDGSKCLECWPGNGLSSSGECVVCIVTSEHGDRCVRCNGDDPSFCTACQPRFGMGGATGYYATAEGECSQCPDSYCKNCTSLTGACTACNRWWGAVNGTCRPCAQDKCLQCDGDVNRCTECGYGRFADPATGRCLNCTDPHCGDCSEAVDKCGSCDSGFSLDKASGRCVACAEGCNTCDEAGPGRCDQGSCDAGWGNVADGTCVRCSAECLDCTSDTKCTNCDTGFGLWKEACQSCGAGCDACTFDGSGKPQCTSCGDGGLDAATKACVPCQQQHCLSCMEDASKCAGCTDGYHLDQAGACEACKVANCSMCDDDAARCNLPIDGYRVTAEGRTEPCSVEHCSWCSEAADKCETCKSGFNLDLPSNSCYACPANCDSCSNKDTCLTCSDSYWRQGGTGVCVKCEPGDATHTECSP